jgi:hypothetical protein
MILEKSSILQINLAEVTVGTGTQFPIPFPYWEKSDIKAVLTTASGDMPLQENPLEGIGYTLTEPNGINGELAPAGDWSGALRLTVYREVPLTQPVNLQNGARLDAEQLERMADRCIAIVQQLKSAVDAGGSEHVPAIAELRSLIEETIAAVDAGREAFTELKQFVELQHGPLTAVEIIMVESGSVWAVESGLQVVV